ncbi:flagellar basal body-associated FliL family protein [Roseivivax isoporae]|uniref:Flagellar protein FliL n=1 Tax=Roseivivax isoporae LMG 25204 TaxID=1449351 RepID=X7FA14_9RHOB|nr:flagellar basal body-associated FliL family protein [Roseivivax isoporae]ETX29640.1 flagellar basal body protein FliL [Roseivivax isoporae LMG 25204]
MTDAAEPQPEAGQKKSRLPLLLGIVLALAGGGGGFFAVSSGLLPLGGQKADAHAPEDEAHVAPGHVEGRPASDVVFVELPQILVSLGSGPSGGHLRFRAALEVPQADAEAVRLLEPRVLDAMNGYLRALEPADIEAREALVMIRAQLTRRVQLVVGSDKVRDLLVLEFVLN